MIGVENDLYDVSISFLVYKRNKNTERLEKKRCNLAYKLPLSHSRRFFIYEGIHTKKYWSPSSTLFFTYFNILYERCKLLITFPERGIEKYFLRPKRRMSL